MISSAFAEDLLKLIFRGDAITGIAQNDTGSPLANLQWSLHDQDPGAGGNQKTHEVSYTGYSRMSAARSSGGFTISGNQMNPASTIEFPEVQSSHSPEIEVTHICIGTASGSNSGKVLFRFALSPTIKLDQNVTPRLRTTTTLTAVTS